MPELPEVETVCRGLGEILESHPTIDRVLIKRKDLRKPVPAKLGRSLKGERIDRVRRRAKFILVDTDRYTLISHLGMTGSWRLVDPGEERKHDHFYMELSDGRRLGYNDPRRFGLLDIVKKGEEHKNAWFSHLGPEPLSEETFTADYLKDLFRGRKAPIKNLIMDQRVVVGVGNIYASEALFLAGIRPSTPAAKVSRPRLDKLVKAIREVLCRAIEAGGTTIRDFRQAGGSAGYFQQQLYVYGREGEACRQCESILQARVIGGRNTFWCRQCQKP